MFMPRSLLRLGVPPQRLTGGARAFVKSIPDILPVTGTNQFIGLTELLHFFCQKCDFLCQSIAILRLDLSDKYVLAISYTVGIFGSKNAKAQGIYTS